MRLGRAIAGVVLALLTLAALPHAVGACGGAGMPAPCRNSVNR